MFREMYTSRGASSSSLSGRVITIFNSPDASSETSLILGSTSIISGSFGLVSAWNQLSAVYPSFKPIHDALKSG